MANKYVKEIFLLLLTWIVHCVQCVEVGQSYSVGPVDLLPNDLRSSLY